MPGRKKFRVALVGTDSLRGKEIKTILSVKKFPLSQIEFYDVDVDEEYGKLTEFRDEPRVIHHPSGEALEGLDLVFLAGGKETSRLYGRLAAEKRFQAVDLSEAFNGHEEVPLVVAGVNDSLLSSRRFPLIANPHPLTIILSSLLHRLIARFGLGKAVVVALQPVSAFDESGIEELASQSAAMLSSAALRKKVFREQIAFNILSHTEAPDPNGFSSGERRVVAEVKKVLGLPDLPLFLSIVQAPVFHTYSVMAYLELQTEADIRSLKDLYREGPLFELSSATSSCAVSSISVAGKEQIFIGQIKREEGFPCSFWIWTVTDNLTRGSALNALEIARILYGLKSTARAAK
ncbi:MAG: Asd/ArgC dimerization domain-containing protein [Candidatus Aminicenantales bacterium]